jgi:crotonobetainyl-CoA:carnitine CoA-transferase CaiB-like acyl-CoA transferase
MALPLEGVRVLALEQFGAGPWATLQLADLGADVIKIEDPATGGDTARYVPPYQVGDSSLFFETFNRNKRSILLDMREPAGRSVFDDLVRVSDAVVSNLRGTEPAKLKIRYKDLENLNPRIVCCSLSGFGMDGPRAPEGAYDFTIQGIAGWMAVTGGPDEPPTKSGLSLVDFSAGYVGAIALLVGIADARKTGRGCDADLSLFETALHLTTYLGTWVATGGYEPKRMAQSAHQSVVPFQTFPTADGWIVVACPKQNLWERLCVALKREDLLEDERYLDVASRGEHRSELVATLEEIFVGDSTEKWLALLRAAGVPTAPVNTIAAALDDDQSRVRSSVVEIEHPTLGTVRQVASPLRLSSITAPPLRRGPLLGEHGSDVLELLGYDDQRVETLRAAGAFGRTEPAIR